MKRSFNTVRTGAPQTGAPGSNAAPHGPDDSPSIRGRKRKTKTSLSGQDGDDDGIHVYEQDDDVLMTSQPSGAVLVRHQYRTELGGAQPAAGASGGANMNLAELDEDTDEEEVAPVSYAHPHPRGKKPVALTKKPVGEHCTNPLYSRKSRLPSKIKRGAAAQPQDDSIWNTEETEERRRVKEFWLGLSEDARTSLIKLEKDGVLKKMKEQQKVLNFVRDLISVFFERGGHAAHILGALLL